MDLFQEPPVDLFADTVPSPEAPGGRPVAPEVSQRTALLGALANLDLDETGESILAALQAKTQAYRDEIEVTGDSSMRAEAASRMQENQLRGLGQVLEDNLPEADQGLTAGAYAAYERIAQADAQENAAWALEQRAAEQLQNLAASGNSTQARLMMQNFENGDALDVMRDYNAKYMILHRMLEQSEVEAKDQPWFRDLADFALSVLPLNAASRTGNVDIDGARQGWLDSLFAGQRFEREADALWDMPLDEFSKFVNEDFVKNLHENATLAGYTNNSEMLELLSGLVERTPSATETNAWNALDVAGLVPVGALTKGGRALMSVPNMLVRNGARREGIEATTAAAMEMLQKGPQAAGNMGMQADEVVNIITPSAINPSPIGPTVSLSGDVNRALENGRRLIRNLFTLQETERLAPAEVAKALQVEQLRIERGLNRTIKDVQMNETALSDGSNVKAISFVVGKKNGDGFVSEAQANRYISSLGETGTAIQDESGQWFAKISVDMPETGFYINPVNVKTPNPWRFLLNARNVGDIDLANAAQVSGNKRNKILYTVVDRYRKVYQGLPGNHKQDLDMVLKAQENVGKWFTESQFDVLYKRQYNRLPTGGERKAFHAARDINDMEYVFRTEDAYKQRTLKGYRTISFELEGRGAVARMNGIIDRELKEVPSIRLYDVSGKRHYNKIDKMSEREWAQKKSQGYIMVTLEQPQELADGTTIKAFIGKGQDFGVEQLRMDQIPYRPGGHRMYRGKHFVKQAVYGMQGDTMTKFLKNPTTFIVGETKAEADFFASRMEAARKLVAELGEKATLTQLDEILGGHAGLPDGEEFLKMLDDGRVQRDTPIGTYYDREMPSDYNSSNAVLDYVDEEETGFNGFLRSNNRMYYSRKGEALRDFRGDLAPTLDSYETINRSLMNIASLSSFSDYKIEAVERWMKTFGKTLDLRDSEGGLSDLRKFMSAPISHSGNSTDKRIAAAAEAQRKIIMRTLGWKTPNDLRAEDFTRRMSDWVAGTRVEGVLPSARKWVAVDWWTDKNPISALRGFAFDLKLGLFNIGQLPLQIGTAVAATTIDPVNGMRGWAMIAPMRFLLGGKSLSPEALEARVDLMIKNGVHGLGGFEPKEFKEFIRTAYRSGFLDLGGSHGLMDHMGISATMDGFASGVQRTREGLRVFFFEAERWNRIVAMRIAWADVKKTNPELAVNSRDFAKRMHGRAEEFAMNMSRESQAYWQKGLLSIPTQFWAYNARMIEAMTIGNFTLGQKLRLVAGQTLLYGSAGVPGLGLVSEFLKHADPNRVMEEGSMNLDKNPSWATLDRGLIDQAIMSFTGADVLASRRMGTGGWIVDTFKNILGMSAYGEVSAAELAGGATYSIMGNVIGPIFKTAMSYMAAESGDSTEPLRNDALMRLVKNVSSVSNTMKALMVHQYGTLESNSGRTTISGLPSVDAFAIALGIQPAESDQVSVIMNHFKDKSKAVKEATQVIANYRTRMLTRPDQAESIQEEVNAYVRLLPEDVRREALKGVPSQIDPSLYASLVERLEKENAEQNGSTD